MKKLVLFLGFGFVIFGLALSGGEDCFEVVQEDYGREFMWDESCDLEWNFDGKRGASDEFKIVELIEKRPYLLQFAGPFTDQDGSAQGLVFEDGEILEDDGDVYSGLVVVDDGSLEIMSVTDYSNIRDEIVDKNLSGFLQALMISEGEVSQSVEENWNLYLDNKSYNYRFLAEKSDGEVRMVDMNNIGLKDALEALLEAGFKKAIYLDIAGSELGYFWNGESYEELGGALVEERYRPSSPGGFLELRRG